MRNRARKALAACVAVCALLCLDAQPAAFAQTCAPTRLRVVVKDEKGGPVSGAEVRVAAASRTTGPEGIAEFNDLACGMSVIRATKEGFQELRNSRVLDGASAE